MRGEAGQLDQPNHGPRRSDENEATPRVLEFSVHLQQHPEAARIDERHARHVDAELPRLRSGEERRSEDRHGVGVDLADRDDAVKGRLDPQGLVIGWHGADGIDK